MKKLFKYFLLALAVIPCAVVLAACGGNGDEACVKTMSMSVNPEVTFTVDKNDKVIAITYDNEDAGTIYANVNFVGKDINDAVDIFVEISAITGHLDFSAVNDFEITVNGENSKTVEAFKNKVLNQVNATCNELGIQVEFDFADAEEAVEDLIEKVKELAPQYSLEELEEMAEADINALVELAKETQEKYAGLAYSQIDEVVNEFTSADGIKNHFLKAVDFARTALNNAEETLNQHLNGSLSNLLTPEFKAKLEGDINTAKENLENAINALEADLDNLIETKTAQANELKATLKSLAEEEAITFKASVEFGNLTEDQQQKINALIEVYFGEAA